MSDNSLSDEDKKLFRQMMAGVKPLRQDNKLDFKPPKPCARLQRREHRSAPENPKSESIYLSDYYAEEVQTNTVLAYCSPSIPNKRFHELKTGQIPWQAKLDLHGLRHEAAKQALIQFIDLQSQIAHRCLLIIHGKGSRQGEAPVLKNLVNRWLPQFPQVLAFHSALTYDGGSGAVYVLLKRRKEAD